MLRTCRSSRDILWSNDAALAKKTRFGDARSNSAHAVMATWPTDHDWGVYWLNISNVFVLDFYGGASPVSVPDYLAAKLYKSSAGTRNYERGTRNYERGKREGVNQQNKREETSHTV